MYISKIFERKVIINILPISLNMCFGAQKNCFVETVLLSNETVLLSTHDIRLAEK